MDGRPLSQFPSTHDLVLVGGGHTHALALRMWAMRPVAGVRLTLIDPHPKAPYSGMLPGCIAGHYAREDLNIDLVHLARCAGARLVIGPAEGIDLEKRVIHVPGRPDIAFDVASIDIGITSAMPDLPGFAEHAVPAKPLGRFAQAWQAYLDRDGPARVAVLGAGVAGAELAMAMAHALRDRGRAATVTLIDRSKALTALRPQTRHLLLQNLAAHGVTLVEDTQVVSVHDGGVETQTGLIDATFVTGAAGAMAYPWLTKTGLRTHNGYLQVSPTLQTSDPMIFAAGDCAHMAFDPRPKAGVYAVRQAPVLVDNLRAVLTGQALRPYRPQKDYLKLISLGGKRAVGERFGLPFSGALVWKLKDRIDQAFMDKFRSLPKMPTPALPALHTPEVASQSDAGALCGGCGAKVGRGALSDVVHGFNDAATVGPFSMSHDHLRAFWDDPVVMTRIAAHHALGDVWATGGTAKSALIALTLPHATEPLAKRMIEEIMASARSVLGAVGTEIAGGHTSFGAELTIGFTVIGENGRLDLTGARPGDVLFLTKPLGTGVIMAAEMALEAPGEVVAEALQHMQRGQAKASDILGKVAHAMTDVTGFGLLGHLHGMCEASRVGAVLSLADIPLMDGALALSRAGHASTLFPQNRAILPDLPADGANALLFDPQTSGGLLAAVPADQAQAVIDAMTAAGAPVWRIGEITSEQSIAVA